MMATAKHKRMPNDGRGPWTERTINDVYVQWRRRRAEASEAKVSLGGSHVVDISLDGGAPETQVDFNETVDQEQDLISRVQRLRS